MDGLRSRRWKHWLWNHWRVPSSQTKYQGVSCEILRNHLSVCVSSTQHCRRTGFATESSGWCAIRARFANWRRFHAISNTALSEGLPRASRRIGFVWQLSNTNVRLCCTQIQWHRKFHSAKVLETQMYAIEFIQIFWIRRTKFMILYTSNTHSEWLDRWVQLGSP